MEEVTIKDIAKICGVGVSTVSRAINNHPDINPETKEMILHVIKEHGYVPNNSARNLKRTDTKSVAVLVKGITNPFFSDMIKVIEEESKKKHYSMYLQNVEEVDDEIDVAQELIKEKRLRGIIFLGGLFSHSEEKVNKLTVPFVFSTVASFPENYDKQFYSSIAVDDRKESARLVEYLIGLGHKKIAIIVTRPSEESIGLLRLQGYKDALTKHNIPIEESLIIDAEYDTEHYSMKNGYLAAKDLIRSGKEFTAVYAVSDTLAIGVQRALLEEGLKIPEQVSVAGYDGLNMVQYISPSLTTVKQPVEAMAKETIKLLFDIIAGKKEHQHIRLEAKICENESTGPCRKTKFS